MADSCTCEHWLADSHRVQNHQVVEVRPLQACRLINRGHLRNGPRRLKKRTQSSSIIRVKILEQKSAFFIKIWLWT